MFFLFIYNLVLNYYLFVYLGLYRALLCNNNNSENIVGLQTSIYINIEINRPNRYKSRLV